MRNYKIPTLTIAGSDSSGGAGIQADLKTFSAIGTYGMSVITAITAQNTEGVFDVEELSSKIIKEQIKAVCEDIMPNSIKIGMVSSPEIILDIAESLKKYPCKYIVVDPVMISKSGYSLLRPEAKENLIKYLIPMAYIVTPNIPEAEVLSGLKINNEEEMLTAAKYIGDHYHCAVLLKGGHQINDANDLLYKEGNYQWFKGKRINNNNTHGTGCTLSSAIASYLARGENLENAVKKAKDYISGALAAMLDLGQGQGPMDHGYVLDKKD